MADGPARYVIVGNGVAGTTAAETLRKYDSTCRITLITDEPYPLYNRVALPPFLKLSATESKVLMRTAEAHAEKEIHLLRETRVIAVNVAGKTVSTNRGHSIPYDRLLIATGGRPNRLEVPGSDAENIFNFQTLDDAKAISARIASAKSAVVVGGSYIAYELAEAFRERGLHTIWLIRGPRFLRRVLDEGGGRLVDQIAREHGVDIRYGEEIAEVKVRGGAVAGVVTTGRQSIEADMVGAGLGLTLNTDFLAGTGVKLDRGIVTNEFLETSVPGIYAAGDIAQYYDPMLGRHNHMGTWDNAVTHGRVVAMNMLGKPEPYVQVPTYTSGLFDSKITVIGTTPELHPGLDAIAKIDMAEKTFKRLFFLDEHLVGAVLIGDRSGRRQIKDLIKTRQSVPVRERAALLEL